MNVALRMYMLLLYYHAHSNTDCRHCDNLQSMYDCNSSQEEFYTFFNGRKRRIKHGFGSVRFQLSLS